jgi:hypothetical protein
MITPTLTKLTFERILVPTDFSDVSQRATRHLGMMSVRR